MDYSKSPVAHDAGVPAITAMEYWSRHGPELLERHRGKIIVLEEHGVPPLGNRRSS